jgi:hypothetical protein
VKAIVVFSDSDQHPLGWMLRKGYRHCFVCMLENGCWMKLDGKEGVPEITYLTQDGFDLAEHYREQETVTAVVEIDCDRRALFGPFMLRNCVGLVKGYLCLRSRAVTPYGLYRYLTRSRSMQLLPGFGGSPAAPAPLPAPVTREDPSIAEAKNKSRLSELKRKGRRASILNGGGGVADGDADVEQPTAQKLGD